MVEQKRWAILYTKHMTQKRKVYHDGVLEVSGAPARVMLYDDCKNLIASRHLKKDEIVQCGATLAFGTHLVEIGEPEGGHKPQACPNATKTNGGPGELGQKENKKVTSQGRPSQTCSNTIDSRMKENKKIKLQNRSLHSHFSAIPSKTPVGSATEVGSSGVSQTHQGVTETSRKEWNAMYTTQKTQKAKKYHDGMLRLTECGSHMNQLILLDEGGAVLSSKYLKSVERVVAGSACDFPNYLVEVGEPRLSLGDDQQKGSSGQVASSSSSSTCSFSTPMRDHNNKQLPEDVQQKVLLGQTSRSRGSKACKFSTPMRNHTKKLLTNDDQHKGPSRHVASFSSHRITTPMEDHNSYSLHNYDQRKGPLEQVVCSSSSSTYKSTTYKKDGNNKPLPNESSLEGIPEQAVGCASSKAQEVPTITGLARNQNLRDACQIISILKRPLPEERFDPRKLDVESASSLCSSDSIHMVQSNKSKALEFSVPGGGYLKSNVLEDHKYDFQGPGNRSINQGDTSAVLCSISEATQIVPCTGITPARENSFEDIQQAQGHASSNNMSRTLFRAWELDSSAASSYIEYMGSGCVDIATSSPGPKSSDTQACTSLITSQQKESVSVLSDEYSREVNDNPSETLSLKNERGVSSDAEQHNAASSGSSLISAHGTTGKGGDDVSSIVSWVQFLEEMTDTKESHESVTPVGASFPACTPAESGGMDLEYQGSSNNHLNIEIPSFDLGF